MPHRLNGDANEICLANELWSFRWHSQPRPSFEAIFVPKRFPYRKSGAPIDGEKVCQSDRAAQSVSWEGKNPFEEE